MSWKWPLILVALPLITLLSATATTSTAAAAVCSSSCGGVNISYPFRLAGDPSGCGRPGYELSCRNNRSASWNHSSLEYDVKSISYDNKTIRLLDPGLQSNNCSALPKYSFEKYFLRTDSPYYSYSFDPIDERSFVTYVRCTRSIDNDPSYIATGPCINSSSSTAYFYLFLGAAVGDLNESCTTIATTPATISNKLLWNRTTYLDVWSDLLMGFELTWWSAHCWNCRSTGGVCLTPGPFRCAPLCRTSFQSISCFLNFAVKFFQDNGLPILTTTGFVLAGRTVIGMMCLFSFLIYKARKRHLSKNSSLEQFLIKYTNLTPARYSYGEIKRMTIGFKHKLGQGGFGSVFKGTLASGRPVAVKLLGKTSSNGEEFINEVATIGRIHHVNVVHLIGFGFEGSKRALIYDYMPNGSLDKYIYLKEGQSSTLSLEKMYEIALGTAGGIEYLHRGCDMQILHFDIKPHNILLDANFTPKVSNFGLAKLYPTDRSVVSVSAAKGTIGYIAPELIYRSFGRISYKSDVYSFGRMLLEMIGRRSKMEGVESDSSRAYFPVWAYDQLMKGEDVEIDVATESESKFAKMLLIVGLWCIQMAPDDRPSMHKVLEMLQGSVEDMLMPPRPSLLFPSLMVDMETSQTMDSSEDLSLIETNTHTQYSP